jgi:hypothetical protein
MPFKTAAWLKECSSKVSQSISGILGVDLPSFTQNLMQTKQNVKLETTCVKPVPVHSAVSRVRLMK